MYDFKLNKRLEKVIKKLNKKDKNLCKQIWKKIDEVVNCDEIESYKNLRNVMKDYKRV